MKLYNSRQCFENKFLTDIIQAWMFLKRWSKKVNFSEFHENPSSSSWIDMTKLIVIFHNFWNASKKVNSNFSALISSDAPLHYWKCRVRRILFCSDTPIFRFSDRDTLLSVLEGSSTEIWLLRNSLNMCYLSLKPPVQAGTTNFAHLSAHWSSSS
jgi:hypothetical protein